MIVIGNSLKCLLKKHGISNDIDSFDRTCLSLRLDKIYKKYNPRKNKIVTYEKKIPKECIITKSITKNGLVLKPKSCVLACSKEKISIPNGYFGFIQTKGSLARLFVTVNCCDGQIDPGYKGKITFEICNFADFSIKIFEGQKISNLYLLKTSSRSNVGYNGRYQNALKPTISKPENRSKIA